MPGSMAGSEDGSMTGPGHQNSLKGDGSMGKSFYNPRATQASVDEVDLFKTEPAARKPYQVMANYIVEHKFFVLFTTILTVYALCGDDFRLMVTDLPADKFFDAMVITCMIVFTFEVCLSCLGKADYPLSFFFVLDVTSTVTLVLDLSWVAAALSGTDQESEDAASNMRGGRTARAGARLGRILRVLRLVRILKLYKTYEEQSTEMKKKTQMGIPTEAGRKPGEDDEWDESEVKAKEAEEASKESKLQESNVGRRLSELTTRKTILLILALLILLQGLKVETTEQLPVSAAYGADEIFSSFKDMVDSRTNSTGAGLLPGVDYQEMFTFAMLKYIYYHNWFAQANPDKFCFGGPDDRATCPTTRYSHLFWIGISSPNKAVIEDKLKYVTFNNAAFDDFEAKQLPGANLNGGYLPPEVRSILSGQWNVDCSTDARKKQGISLLTRKIPETLDYTLQCPEEIRAIEQGRYFAKMVTNDEFNDWRFEFYFDERPFSQEQAFLSLMLMLFLLVLLVLSSFMFTYDANRLIVNPVEKMIRNVSNIKDDPLVATKMADDELKREEMMKARAKQFNLSRWLGLCRDVITCTASNSKEEPMETLILEKTIVKLGSLLALGFGEAGANIIRHNMMGQDSATINAMVPGTIVNCIIGNCRVRDFSVATEVLQSKINAFVNLVAEIVHGVADEFHGAPNKNNGETFLIIWRVEQHERAKTKRMAELSLVAFAKILGAVHASPVLAVYRSHPRLQYRLGKDCRVNVSFGLHAGWAIEGAVGSEFKIDASYLSPHVSVAINIELLTTSYDVSILVAESVIDLCNVRIAAMCRLIDKLKITGSTEPLQIYCVDLDYRKVNIDQRPPLRIHWSTRNRFKARQFLETQKALKLEKDTDVASLFETDDTIQEMRQSYTVEFFQLFNMGYQNYFQGEWQVAKRMLEYVQRMIPGIEDGPSCALLRFMEVPHQFEPPSWWEGVREMRTEEIGAPPVRPSGRQVRRHSSIGMHISRSRTKGEVKDAL